VYKRLTKVDSTMLNDHCYLDSKDYCTFMGEYTAKKGYSFSDTNQLISNFKKPLSVKNTNQWQHKLQAMNIVSDSLVNCLKESCCKDITFVPIPPSKISTDAEYDDRLVQSLKQCQKKLPDIEYRELVFQTKTTNAVHTMNNRLHPNKLIEIYKLDMLLVEGVRNTIIIYDDMLTTGAHFRAMKSVLLTQFPDSVIAGLFIARRAPDAITDIFTV